MGLAKQLNPHSSDSAYMMKLHSRPLAFTSIDLLR